MLVLSRKPDERVYLQVGDITITIVVSEVRPGFVRLGFDAPLEVKILRDNAVKSDPKERTKGGWQKRRSK